MANIKVRGSSVYHRTHPWHAGIARNLRRASRTGINGMGPGVGSERLEAMRHPPLELNLKGVVGRRGGVIHKICLSNIRVARRGPKYDKSLQEPYSSGSNVRRRYSLLPTQRLIQRDVPLKSIGRLQIRIKRPQL